jgi:outer membrane protein assembly factor BamD (BamD/ComL family)
MTRTTIRIAACTAALLAVLGCASSAAPAPTDDLTAAEFFQRAQDASDKGNYTLAIQYYEQFQAKYPEDTAHQAMSAYEIAMLYHKMGNNAKAIELLDALLARYQAGEALPDAPRILATKLRARLVAAMPQKKEAATPPAEKPASGEQPAAAP